MAEQRMRSFPMSDIVERGLDAVVDDAVTVACGEGAGRLSHLQRAGRGAMTAEDFLRGTPVAPETILG